MSSLTFGDLELPLERLDPVHRRLLATLRKRGDVNTKT